MVWSELLTRAAMGETSLAPVMWRDAGGGPMWAPLNSRKRPPPKAVARSVAVIGRPGQLAALLTKSDSLPPRSPHSRRSPCSATKPGLLECEWSTQHALQARWAAPRGGRRAPTPRPLRRLPADQPNQPAGRGWPACSAAAWWEPTLAQQCQARAARRHPPTMSSPRRGRRPRPGKQRTGPLLGPRRWGRPPPSLAACLPGSRAPTCATGLAT